MIQVRIPRESVDVVYEWCMEKKTGKLLGIHVDVLQNKGWYIFEFNTEEDATIAMLMG